MESVDWLMLAGTVLVASLVLARVVFRLYMRRGDASQASTGFAAWVTDHVGRNWPILALLLLVASPVVGLRGHWVTVAAGAIALWWIGEAVVCRQLPRTRNPLALLCTAMRRLWRNRSLLIALVALWLVSATVSYLLYVRTYAGLVQRTPPYPVRLDETSGSSEQRTQRAEQMKTADGYAVWTGNAVVVVESVTVLPTTLARALPQVENISVGYLGHYLLPAVLFMALVWVAVRLPAWFPATLRRRLFWPLNLTLASFLVGSAYLLPLLRLPQNSMASAIVMHIFYALHLLAMAALSAPFVTMLWHVGMQVARGERWNLRSALLGMLETWQPICIMAVVISVPTFLMLAATGPPFYGSSVWVYRLGTALKVALALVPWIIVDQRVGLRKALSETWRLASNRAWDMLIFALRFTVMFAVPAVLIHALRPSGLHSPTPTAMIDYLARDLFAVLQALVIAGMYLELRGRGPQRRAVQAETDGVADPLGANSEEATHAG